MPGDGPVGTPDFASFEPKDFLPAFQIAIAKNTEEIEAIVEDQNQPGSENVIAALERAGSAIARVRRVFWMLLSAPNRVRRSARLVVERLTLERVKAARR